MNGGEVWWGEQPDVGRRPYLVLTREAPIPVLTGIFVAQISRTVRGIATEVALDLEDGMPERSPRASTHPHDSEVVANRAHLQIGPASAPSGLSRSPYGDGLLTQVSLSRKSSERGV